MEYKGFLIKILCDSDTNDFCVGVFKNNIKVYTTESWHFSEDPDFYGEDAKVELIKKMIDIGEIK